MLVISLQKLYSIPARRPRLAYVVAHFIRTDAAHDNASVPEQVRAIREIPGRAAQLTPRRKQVPEKFSQADANEGTVHEVFVVVYLLRALDACPTISSATARPSRSSVA